MPGLQEPRPAVVLEGSMILPGKKFPLPGTNRPSPIEDHAADARIAPAIGPIPSKSVDRTR